MDLQEREEDRQRRKGTRAANARASAPAASGRRGGRGSASRRPARATGYPWYFHAAAWLVLGLIVFGVYRHLAADRPGAAAPAAEQPSLVAPGATAAGTAPRARATPSQLAKEVEAEKAMVAAAQAAAVAREEQFKAFFKPTPGCQLRPGTVDCANEYIRARRAFDLAQPPR